VYAFDQPRISLKRGYNGESDFFSATSRIRHLITIQMQAEFSEKIKQLRKRIPRVSCEEAVMK
jgi:hypothetical protein